MLPYKKHGLISSVKYELVNVLVGRPNRYVIFLFNSKFFAILSEITFMW